ncbi:MAG TPA: NifB/NifX family molybdenum-iron cluster-binding protein [Phycisphaerae bacterium]|nr:NifB/NifX family molybdenum-iron cluster-binding protein [Phycisphaerae bacterium]HUW30659.1 NifB/NifX family molybdenum-iron cluster-binding protein [Planctomycetota bacterium]
MRYAIPVANGRMCLHFGHCEEFVFVDVGDDGEITHVERKTPPPHAPGVIPAWAAQEGAQIIIAGGMGMRAQQLFRQYGIDVIVGAAAETPEELVLKHVAGTLETGDNVCDH